MRFSSQLTLLLHTECPVGNFSAYNTITRPLKKVHKVKSERSKQRKERQGRKPKKIQSDNLITMRKRRTCWKLNISHRKKPEGLEDKLDETSKKKQKEKKTEKIIE